MAAGSRVPGDVNADGLVDISDGVGLLGHLFAGVPEIRPCDGGTVNDIGNIGLLDRSGDGLIDISDPIFALGRLFLGENGHPRGPTTACVLINGCSPLCP